MAGTGPLGALPPSGGGRGWRAVRPGTEVRGEGAGIAALPGRGVSQRAARSPAKAPAAGVQGRAEARGCAFTAERLVLGAATLRSDCCQCWLGPLDGARGAAWHRAQGGTPVTVPLGALFGMSSGKLFSGLEHFKPLIVGLASTSVQTQIPKCIFVQLLFERLVSDL